MFSAGIHFCRPSFPLTRKTTCPDNHDMDSGISSRAQMWPMGWNQSWVRDAISFAAKPMAVFVECWLTRLFENKNSGISLKVIFLIQEKMTNYQGPLVPHDKLSESGGLMRERKKVLLEARVHWPSLQAWFQRDLSFGWHHWEFWSCNRIGNCFFPRNYGHLIYNPEFSVY